MRLLIGIPSPRDIPEVLEAMETIKHDKLWVKYKIAREAYSDIIQFFTEHKEYSHLAISPDDLIPTAEGVQALVEGVEREGFQVLTAWCAIDSSKNTPEAAVTSEPVQLQRDGRRYEWVMRKTLLQSPERYRQFPHATTAFMIFSRSAVKVTDWGGDLRHNPQHIKHQSLAQDVVISHSLNQAGIPIMVDCRVEFQHLRFAQELKVGKEEPRIIHQTVPLC